MGEDGAEAAAVARPAPWRVTGAWFATNLTAERARWPLWLPAFMGAGIGVYFWLSVEPALWIGPALLAAAIAALGASWRYGGWRWPAAVTVALTLGFAAAQFEAHSVAAPVLGHRIIGPLAGRVLVVDPLPEGSRLTIVPSSLGDLAPADLPARVRVRLRHGDGGVTPGDGVRLRVSLEPPPAPAMPGAYDFQRRAWFERLGGVGYALSAPEKFDAPAPGAIVQAIEAVRHGVTRRIRAALPGPDGAIAAALITGETHAIPPDDAGAFRDAGLAHILVIAGLHMGMVAGICFFALRALFALIPPIVLNHPTKKYAAALALLLTFLYMLLSGTTVSSRRAFVMTALALVAILLDRLSLSARALALAAVAIMLMTPDSATGPSFQMSFAAVAALVAFYEAWRGRFAAWHRGAGTLKRLGLYALGIAFTTMVTTVATAPFTVYHFNRLPLYSVAANVVAVPITGFWVMPWAIVACLLMPVHLESVALIPMSWGIDAVTAIAKGVTSWPGAVLTLPSMPAWGIAVAAAGGLWLAIWRRRWRWWGVLPLAIGLLSAGYERPPDILIAGDAKLVAVRAADGSYLPSKAKGEHATADSWTKRAAAAMGPAWPAAGLSADGLLACDGGSCRYSARGAVVTLLRDPDAFDRAQCQADLVVAPVPAWKICPGARIVDRVDAYRDGGYAVWLDAGTVRLESVRDYQGARLWSPRQHERVKVTGEGS
ncbi:MAG: ComEC/Rec2 family competence protein [Alphaproteobacteria bacterium]|nr:ComEC/Rec2 family competence protein [Alphaproteobacteria bacterium]